MSVNIRAQFGKKERQRNGLEAIADELNSSPDKPRLVICLVECAKTEINHLDGDSKTAKVSFVDIEPVLDAKDLAAARKIYERARKTRNGNSPEPELPIDDGEGDD